MRYKKRSCIFHNNVSNKIHQIKKKNKIIKGYAKRLHGTSTASRQGKVEQVYIKNKCGYSILLDTVKCCTQ